MGELTKEDLVKALQEVLHAGVTIGDAVHTAHHAYIDLQIKNAEKRAAMLEKFKMSIIGTMATSVVAGLVWLGTVVFNSLHHIKG